MDAAIKAQKKKMDKGMDSLLKKDIARDRKCDMKMKKKPKK